MVKRQEWNQSFVEAAQVFEGLKGFRIANLNTLLIAELPALMKLASERVVEQYFDSPTELWFWWLRIQSKVPT